MSDPTAPRADPPGVAPDRHASPDAAWRPASAWAGVADGRRRRRHSGDHSVHRATTIQRRATAAAPNAAALAPNPEQLRTLPAAPGGGGHAAAGTGAPRCRSCGRCRRRPDERGYARPGASRAAGCRWPRSAGVASTRACSPATSSRVRRLPTTEPARSPSPRRSDAGMSGDSAPRRRHWTTWRTAVVRASTARTSAHGRSGDRRADDPPPAVARAPRHAPEITAADGPLHRIARGHHHRHDSHQSTGWAAAAPVNCLVSTPIYSTDQQVLDPGRRPRSSGTTKPVQSFGETRLAVAFTRLVMPNGRTYSLDHFMGLNAIGDAGLRDQVNQHYASTFGVSAAVGLISGFAQYLGGGFVQPQRAARSSSPAMSAMRPRRRPARR